LRWRPKRDPCHPQNTETHSEWGVRSGATEPTSSQEHSVHSHTSLEYINILVCFFIRCGRTDFQQGSSSTLYDSVHSQIFSLPAETKVYPGHDYKVRRGSIPMRVPIPIRLQGEARRLIGEWEFGLVVVGPVFGRFVVDAKTTNPTTNPNHQTQGATHSSVGAESATNPRLSKPKEDFISLMAELQLAHPKMIDVAVPANLMCGIP
jgi:hypothetical protein